MFQNKHHLLRISCRIHYVNTPRFGENTYRLKFYTSAIVSEATALTID
jgi:hypothetical protein